MSKGGENKSMEERQAEQQAEQHAQRLAQAGGPKPAVTDARAEDAERKRQRQSLELQRERILSERTSSPHRRTALTNALADIEEKLAELGWTIHL
jgi:hypothetical protein